MVVSCNGGIGVWAKKISQILYVLPIEKKRGSGRDREKKKREGKRLEKIVGREKKTRGRKNWEKMWQMGENQNFGYCNRNF